MKWLVNNFQQFLDLFLQHTVLAVVPTLLGLLIAVPVGMLVQNAKGLRRGVVLLCSIIFTIPSLALFVVIPSVIGTRILNPLNVVVALTLYSVALLVRTVLEALDSVPDDVKQAAVAMGTSRTRLVFGIELPLSVPVLTAGTRVVAVTNVSLVSVGAVIGIGGLGQLFTAGYQRDYPDQIMAGIIGILVLSFVFDRILAWGGTALTPWTRAGKVTRREQRERRRAAAGTERRRAIAGGDHVR